MSAGKGGPPGAETEGSEWCPAPPYQAPPGGRPRVTALQGPGGHIPLQSNRSLQPVYMRREVPG